MRSCSCHVCFESPHGRIIGIHDPILQIHSSDVVNSAQHFLLSDHLMCQCNSWNRPIVEAEHINNTRFLRQLHHCSRFISGHRHRFFAVNMFAGLHGCHCNFGMVGCRCGNVNYINIVSGNNVTPISTIFFPSEI